MFLRFQVSGENAVTTRNYMDKECIRMLNGLEKTLERKVPERERRWQVAEESAEYGVNDEPLPQGWPIAEE